ncbi:NAD(P)-binding domain-containing protein [Actinocorallia longicatena]|uniref:Pyrroline-5-carboxylate reductase catalytic N-terminal domain-containing protein n=1 Tax=Actinocorallia longicatena TaxID=111803 RepID=A0ABP6QM63_9ACTN
MDVAVIGTGTAGRALGEALTVAGHLVRYGSRTPEDAIKIALDGADAVILAIPGAAVADFLREHAPALDAKIVIDGTNKHDGDGPTHSAAEFAILAPGARYARAFNALAWRSFADRGAHADLFYSAEEADRPTVERLIRDCDLTPVPLGPAQYDLLDRLLELWSTLEKPVDS